MNPPALTRLEAGGLIRPVAGSAEPAYTFRHALGQDAAYASLLRADRRRLHRAVAETLEGFYPEQLDDLAPVLADHFAQADAPMQALYYFTLAGDQAARKWANSEAIRHYSRALDLARQEEVGSSTLIPLVTRRGRALELSGDYTGALAGYTDLHALGRALDDAPMELAALIAQAGARASLSPTHDRVVGEDLCRQALVLARALNDAPAEARILWILMQLHSGSGGQAAARQAIAYGEASLMLARRLSLREQVAITLNDLAYSYRVVGQTAAAQSALAEACALLRALGNLPLLADNLTRSATNLYFAGDLAGATALVDEGYAVSQAIGNGWGQAFSRMIGAMIALERDDIAAMQRLLDEAIHLSDQSGFVIGLVAGRGYLGLAHALQGDLVAALTLARATVAAAATYMPLWQPHALRGLALIQSLRGDSAAAMLLLREAADSPVPTDVLTYSVYLQAEGETRLAAGDAAGLLTLLDDLLPSVQQIGIRPAELQIGYYRARALAAIGHAAAADALLRETAAAAEALGAWRLVRLCRESRAG